MKTLVLYFIAYKIFWAKISFSCLVSSLFLMAKVIRGVPITLISLDKYEIFVLIFTRALNQLSNM